MNSHFPSAAAFCQLYSSISHFSLLCLSSYQLCLLRLPSSLLVSSSPSLVKYLRHISDPVSSISTALCIYEVLFHNHSVMITPKNINSNSIISSNAQPILKCLPPSQQHLFYTWFFQIRRVGMLECYSVAFLNRK